MPKEAKEISNPIIAIFTDVFDTIAFANTIVLNVIGIITENMAKAPIVGIQANSKFKTQNAREIKLNVFHSCADVFVFSMAIFYSVVLLSDFFQVF